MEIKYLGRSSFLLKTKTARVVTDPFSSDFVGVKFPKVEADIITVSHDHKDHNEVKAVISPTTGAPTVIDMPGEFEKLGVRIFGFRSFHDKVKGAERGDNVMYKFEIEGMSVLHCGDLGAVPEDSFLDLIGDVDILLVPVGGKYTLDAVEAAELVKKIEPALIIPMHYGQKDLLPVSDFTAKFGVEKAVPLPKLMIKKEELLDEMKVIVLES